MPPDPTSTSIAASGLQGTGAPLEAGARDALSTSFRHDFSSVRVHTGPHAERAASSLGARAYTVGNDVVFGQGAYDPLGGCSINAERARRLVSPYKEAITWKCYDGAHQMYLDAQARTAFINDV